MQIDRYVSHFLGWADPHRYELPGTIYEVGVSIFDPALPNNNKWMHYGCRSHTIIHCELSNVLTRCEGAPSIPHFFKMCHTNNSAIKPLTPAKSGMNSENQKKKEWNG